MWNLQRLWDCPINISSSAGSYNPEESHLLHCGMNYHLEIMLAETLLLLLLHRTIDHFYSLAHSLYATLFSERSPCLHNRALEEERLISSLVI